MKVGSLAVLTSRPYPDSVRGINIGDLVVVREYRCRTENLEITRVVNNTSFVLRGFCREQHLKLLAEPDEWWYRPGVDATHVEHLEKMIYGEPVSKKFNDMTDKELAERRKRDND